jgi:hypothetical protein
MKAGTPLDAVQRLGLLCGRVSRPSSRCPGLAHRLTGIAKKQRYPMCAARAWRGLICVKEALAEDFNNQ